MRSFIASVYKDICLFLSASGVLGLLLPVLVALLMLVGFNDTAEADLSIRPFAVAVVDLDETMMSRSLISQFKRIDMFSSVEVYTNDELTSVFGNGCIDENGDLIARDGLFRQRKTRELAAVITLPKDFFYDIYTGDEKSVRLVSNSGMSVESRLVEDVVSGVGRMIAGERAAWQAAYTEKYGADFADDPALFDEYLDNAARSIIDGALGRRSVFADDERTAEIKSNVKNTFFACSSIMLFFLVSLGVLKTLPDEKRIGLFDRFVSAGGNIPLLIMSKLVSALFFVSAGTAPLILILRPDLTGGAAAALALAFLSSFFTVLALCSITKNTEQLMLVGGTVTAFSLLFGGAIYPYELLPDALKKLSSITNARHLIYALSNGESIVKNSLVPLGVITAAAMIFAAFFYLVGSGRSVKKRIGGAKR